EPGARMESMMAPTVVLDADGLELAIGAAGGTRLRTALVTVLAGIIDEGLAPQEAVERPRVHPADAVVNAEPGVEPDGLAALEASGRTVRRWPDQPLIRGGMEPRWLLVREAERDPADVAALGTAGILLHRAAGNGLRVDLAALEAADGLEDGEGVRRRQKGVH